ncbi:hypothetical protein [Nonomuraea sp. NPDC050783]|uniref:hypothetical protein n=1 Tax=Nonomuraea sp. NPDC050783 TaxID=3154634 RepID=UPI003465A7AB
MLAAAAPPRTRERTLYALISPACGLCSQVLPALAGAAHDRPELEVVLVTAAPEAEARAYLDARGVRLPLLADPDVFAANGIPWPPFAVLTGRDGLVEAAGGISSPESLAALLVEPAGGPPPGVVRG